MKCLEIPTRDSGEVVEVYPSELGEDEVEGVCELIASEEAPTHLYINLAIALPRRCLKRIVDLAVSDCKLRDAAAASELLSMHAAECMRQGALDEAASLLNQAERLDGGSTTLWARKGLLLLKRTNVLAAHVQFKAILDKDGQSVVGRVGMALVKSRRGEASDADFLHLHSVIQDSRMRRALIMASAMDLFKQGLVKEAVARFEQATGQNDYEALKCLGVCLINGLEQLGPDSVAKGLMCLKRFYEEHDKEDPLVLIYLADHFHFKKDYHRASLLAGHAAASDRLIDDKLRAKIVYLQAKCAHSLGNYDEAFNKYLACTKHDPSHQAALFGLGQMYVHRRDFFSAIKCFESVKDDHHEVREMLGCLYLQQYTETGDMAWFKKASLQLAGAFTSLPIVQLAQAMVMDAQSSSLPLYECHAGIVQQSWQLLANQAVILYSMHKYEDALECIDRALSLNSTHPSVLYTHACIRYAIDGNVDHFRSLPNHREAMLQLGHLYLNDHKYAEASDAFKDALGMMNGKDLEAWYGLGVCHLRQRAFTPARKSFERILAEHDKHDQCALTGLSIVYLELSRTTQSSSSKDAAQGMLMKSLEFAAKAISLDPGNMVAANCAAVVLMEMGLQSAGRDAFVSIKGALGECQQHERFMLDVLTNLGNALVECGQYEEALPAYQSACQLIGNNANRLAPLHMAWARAAYAHGKHLAKLSSLQLAIDRLSGILSSARAASHDGSEHEQTAADSAHIDEQLREMAYFDLALALQESAATGLKSPSPSIDMMQSVSENIHHSIDIFTRTLASAKHVDLKAIGQRLQYSQSLCLQVDKKLSELTDKEKQMKSHIQSVKLERERAEMLERERERLVQQEWQREQAEIEEQRRQLSNSVISASNAANEDSTERPRRKRRRKQLSVDEVSDGSDVDSVRSREDGPDEFDDLFSENK